MYENSLVPIQISEFESFYTKYYWQNTLKVGDAWMLHLCSNAARNVTGWCNDNDLRFNVTKTKEICIVNQDSTHHAIRFSAIMLVWKVFRASHI